jgi:hypothetical protein
LTPRSWRVTAIRINPPVSALDLGEGNSTSRPST